MNHVMRKPVFALCNNKDTDPRSLISVFVIRCLDSIMPLSFYIRNFKPIASFCGCTGRFDSTMVANPKDRFSHDVAHS